MEDSKSASSTVSTEDQVSNQDKIDGKGDVVSYETHKKLLGQLKTWQAKVAKVDEIENAYLTAQQKLQAIEAERAAKEEAKLIEKGEKDKIIELREKKINELSQSFEQIKKERDALNESMVTSDKLYSFYEKLPGKIKRNEYLKHVPIEKIIYDPETKRVDEQSVDIVVNEFMEKYADLVDTKSGRMLPSDYAKSNLINSNNFGSLPLKEMKSNIKSAVAQAKAKLGVN